MAGPERVCAWVGDFDPQKVAGFHPQNDRHSRILTDSRGNSPKSGMRITPSDSKRGCFAEAFLTKKDNGADPEKLTYSPRSVVQHLGSTSVLLFSWFTVVINRDN